VHKVNYRKGSFEMDKTDKLSNNHLQVGNSEKDWGLYVISVGNAVMGNIKENPELHRGTYLWPDGHCFDYFNIIYIASGSMIYYPDPKLTKSVVVSAGNILISLPGVRHRYHANPKTGVEEYWIKFDGYYARELQKNGIIPLKTSVIGADNHSSLYSLFQEIHSESTFDQNLNTQIKMLPKLISILSFFSYSKQRMINPIIEKAVVFMHANITESCDFSKFARGHGMSPHNFRRVFKNITGLPPLQYFLELKINKAKEMLEHERHSVKEIAHILGFDDPYYFSRIFRKKTGIPPCQWGKSV
jgi:AraC-like DNA-binding protein